MPNDPDLNDPRNLWQNQEGERMTITLDDVRSIAIRFERRIRRRNLREYVAGAIVIAYFGASPWFSRAHGWRAAAPALLTIVGTIYVMFQLHRRGAAGSLPIDAALRASLDFHIRELERQSDALHGVWHWYLLPFVPGLAAVLVVTGIDRGINATLIGVGIFFVLTFVGIWALNEWAARKLDRKIQELRAMETDHE